MSIEKKKYCSLDQLGEVYRGRSQHRPRNASHLYGGKYPFIQTADITRSSLYITDYSQTYSESGLSQSRLWESDTLCIVNAGVNTGDNAILKFKACFPDSVIGFRAAPSRADVRFVKYYLDSIKTQIKSITMGATQDNLSVSKLLTFKIPKIDVESQRKIAAILCAYDDLIENNKRRIALLEKMAEEIYREWFVRFRFPGHDKVKFVKGVPAGWEVLPFSKAVLTNPVERVAKEVEKPYVGMEALSVSSMYFSSKEMRTGNAGSKFRNHDVLLPRITPSLENGKRGYVMTLEEDQVGIGSTEFIVFREKILTSEHIYLLTCSSDFRKHAELSMAGASGRQRVQEDSFDFFLVNVPPQEIRQRFTQIVRPYFSAVRALSNENINLLSTRDLLLPRLISGKLSVENLDIRFPPSMEETDGEA